MKYEDYEQVAGEINVKNVIICYRLTPVELVADIPGLISGAHRNRGLGIAFLRHIERCVCLLYMIDTSQPEPWEQLDVLRYELGQYNGDLLSRPSGIVANKMDMPQSELNVPELTRHAKDLKIPIFPISAQKGEGLLPVLQYMRKLYDETRTGRAPE